VAVPAFPFDEDLTFLATEVKGPGSPFRYWPDGLPFRLAPGALVYTPTSVTLSSPVTYEPNPPDSGGIPAESLIECQGLDCTAPATIHNGGYFNSADWMVGSAAFGVDGLDVVLALDASVTYESTFPRGVKMTLLGPATIEVRDSAVTQGGFADGTVVLSYGGLGSVNGTCEPAVSRALGLDDSTPPVILADGALLAAVDDLNTAVGTPISWTFNQASDLGCGTLYVPAVAADKGPPGTVQGPQHVWLDSRVTPARGRGIYAGVNYNRDRVCAGGAKANELCTTSADCPGVGGICVADRFSPMCPAFDSLVNRPTWTATIEGSDVADEILPDEPAQADREMAFFVRGSGVTGVFDLGANPRSIGDGAATFDIDFSELGFAFLGSRSERFDTITDGAVGFPWPSDTDVPFNELTACDCGQLHSASVPENLSQRVLGYWDAHFDPFGLTFSDDADPLDCGDPASRECSGGSVSTAACLDAILPTPHFSPDLEGTFGLSPDGTPKKAMIDGDEVVIQPASEARLNFDENSAGEPPYTYDLTGFDLQTWPAAADYPTMQEVVLDEVEPYGWRDAVGEIHLPMFGTNAAGILVRREHGSGLHRVDVHESGYPDDPTHSFLPLTADMAGGSVQLDYNLDYFTPSTLHDPIGDDADGRGLFFGYQPDLNLGSIAVGSGLILEPDSILGDVGPAGVMRMWGHLSHSGAVPQEVVDQLDEIMEGAGRLGGAWQARYDQALDLLDGTLDGTLPLGDQIPVPDLLSESMHDTLDGLVPLDLFEGHPDFSRIYEMDPPVIQADKITGFIDFSPLEGAGDVVGDLGTELPELAMIDAALSTGGEFFSFARSQLNVRRQVDAGVEAIKQPIMDLGRKQIADAVQLPGKQEIAFPLDIPGVQWKFDYDVAGIPPVFTFNSLQGSLQVNNGGLSALGFRELGATLWFDADANWYFRADAELDFRGNGVDGHLLLGNTATLDPLIDLDPDVASFLGDATRFNGAYLRCGISKRLIDLDCLLRLDVGAEVGGWYLAPPTDSFGGRLAGSVSGRGICLLSVKGKLVMIGGKVGDQFRLSGDHWVAGGLGFCEENEWDTPRDVLRDDWCWACVLEAGVTFTYPEAELSFDGLDKACR
jgi:hypothetical protein